MKYSSRTFYCFSPPVMLATFVIEIALLIFVIWKYRISPLIRVVAAILAMLAIFQLAEYNVCEGFGGEAALWSRIGFVAITLLPPLGLHLAYLLARNPDRSYVFAGYTVGLLWVLLFSTSDWAFVGHQCGGNYVIFKLRDNLMNWYGLYYYGLLVLGIWRALVLARQATKKRAKALLAMVFGYLIFMLPNAIANTLRPETLGAIPSIMCGFAVFFAILLVVGILPLVSSKRDMN